MSKILTRDPHASDEWRTPPDLFAALDQEFRFDMDLAATEVNTLVPVYLVNALEEVCGLVGSIGFLNPPYSAGLIGPFLERALAATADWVTTVALVPDTPDTRWYQILAGAQELRHIPHRVKYLRADGVSAAGAMFPSCVAVFRPQPGVRQPAGPRHVTWDYRRAR